MLTRRDQVWQCRSRARLLVLALILVGLQAPPAAGADLVAFKVGISDRVNTVLPLWMAEAGGFYDAQGLRVEIVTMGGGSRGAQELQAGRIDVIIDAIGDLAMAAATTEWRRTLPSWNWAVPAMRRPSPAQPPTRGTSAPTTR